MTSKGYNKYRAKKVIIDGITFASEGEAARYRQLKLLEQAGQIKDLIVHPRFELFPKTKVQGETVGSLHYTADFQYNDLDDECTVVEDYKSKATMTEAAALRINLFRRQYPGLVFRIVTKEDL